MNNKAFTLSLLMAILAVFFVQSYVSSIEEEQRKKFGTEVSVVVASRDIKEMQTINETMIKTEPVPKRFLEPSAIYFEKTVEDKDKTRSLKNLAGTVALVPIKKGEQISYNKLIEPSIRTGLAPQITPGRRAISIPIGETSGVAKLVKPGDRVDVLATVDLDGKKQDRIARTVLQDVVVLATGRSVSNNAARVIEHDDASGQEKIRSLTEDSSYSTVTIEVEPPQAQMLALLIASGDSNLTLSLRNNDDSDRVTLGTTTFGDILGVDSSRLQRGVASGRQ